MRQPIDLIGGFYTDDTLEWSQQDTVNYLPVKAEVAGTRSQTKLVDAPGLKPYAWIGHDASGTTNAPIRGLHDVEGKLFAVCGQTLYQISNAGVAIPRGTIPGVGRVSMAHNEIASGNQLIVVNGSSGYVWNTAAETFQKIVDEGYPGAKFVDFIDQYLMQVEPFGRFLFMSDLSDALSYNTLDRFEAETQPDKVTGVIVTHQEVWAFGERTIDVFYNTGNATGTFSNKGVSLSKGCIAGFSPAIVDNGVAWLGHDRVVYHARGYDPIRISTRAIEAALSAAPLASVQQAFSFVWEDRGHSVYYLTVPGFQTFGYDFSTGLWHRRASLHPLTDVSGRWRINHLVRSNGKWIGSDYQTGKLYELDWDYMLEGDDAPHVRERVSPVAHADGRRIRIDSIELRIATGGPETDPVAWPTQPVGPAASGDAPDTVAGDAYSYDYTLTIGDADIASVKVVSGSLPPGLAIDKDGHLTGATTDTPAYGETAVYSYKLRYEDKNGLWAEVSDTITVHSAEILPPQLSDWRYLQIDNDDDSDYSATDFDDSEWATGPAPFGKWAAGTYSPENIADGAPDGLNNATEYDSRFATEFATNWDENTRLWLRRTLNLAAVPASDISVKIFIDDQCDIYVNGSLVLSTPADHDAGVGQSFTIDTGDLVVGDNIIAIRCKDEEPPGAGPSVVYFDMILELS